MRFTLLQITIITSILFSILMLISVPFVLMLRKLYFKISRKRIFSYYSLFLIIYIWVLFASRDSLPLIERNILYYLGFLNFALFISLLYWLLFLIFLLFKKQDLLNKVKHLWLILILLLTFVSIYNFEKPIAVESYEFFSDNVSKEYNFVQITDTQYGTIDLDHVKKSFQLAIEQKPDFILFTGDFVDFEGYQREDFDFIDEIVVPIYFVRGNHGFYHNEFRLLSIVKNLTPMQVLINNKTNYEEIEIVGIDFTQDVEIFKEEINKINVSEDKFSILLYHDPRKLVHALDKNYDLILAGHTHGGQIFPITYIFNFFYPYWNGYYLEGSTHIYTSDGAGLWGPRMRLGSQNEITRIKVSPI